MLRHEFQISVFHAHKYLLNRDTSLSNPWKAVLYLSVVAVSGAVKRLQSTHMYGPLFASLLFWCWGLLGSCGCINGIKGTRGIKTALGWGRIWSHAELFSQATDCHWRSQFTPGENTVRGPLQVTSMARANVLAHTGVSIKKQNNSLLSLLWWICWV